MGQDGELARRVGVLLSAARGSRLWSQQRLADQLATSQQWISRIERGSVDLRVGRIERVFAALGKRVVIEIAPLVGPSWVDPDLLGAGEKAEAELASFVRFTDLIWRRLAGVPFVVAGRLGALAQGLPVRADRMDLRVAESDALVVSRALQRLNMPRWHDRLQEYVGQDPDLTGPGPMRWFAGGLTEMRIQLVPEIHTGLTVAAGRHTLPVVPLAELIAADPDVAELHSRLLAAGRSATSEEDGFPQG